MSKKVDKYILVDGKHGRHDSKGNLVIYRAGVKGQNMLTLTKAEARALGNKVKSLAAVRAELAVFDEEEETEDILEKEVGPEGSTKMQGVDDEEDEDEDSEDVGDSDEDEDIDEEEEDWDFSEMNGPDVITLVNSLDSVDDLEAALDSEKEGKNRVTVINAINHRIEAIEEEEEEEEDEDEG